MEKDKLLIVFVKNMQMGKVKTRLAKAIGDNAAFEVYKGLLSITEEEIRLLDNDIDVHIYFSSFISNEHWDGYEKFAQKGIDLGERMQDAFARGFEMGYKRIIGIGSDLPDINSKDIKAAFEILNTSDTVFGPARDGGYYLIGMRKMFPYLFQNKPWSTDQLLNLTMEDLNTHQNTYYLLKTLNDIDTIDDLKTSSVYLKFKPLYELP